MGDYCDAMEPSCLQQLMNGHQLTDAGSVCLLNSSSTVVDADRLPIAVCVLLFSTVSVALNVLLVVAILVDWLNFSKQLFAHFVLSMLLAGLQYTAVNFFVSIPCAFSYCQYIASDWLMVTLATPNTLSFFAYLLASFAFSIYRFVSFVKRKYSHNMWFYRCCLYLPWLLAVYITVDTNVRGCFKRYNRWALAYTYNCSNCSIWFGVSFIDFNFYVGQILPLVMFVIYATIIIDVFLTRTSYSTMKHVRARDANLAFQYILICTSQYLASFLFYIIPKLAHGHPAAVAAMNTIGVVNVALNPLILICFNAQMQSATLRLLTDLNIFNASKRTSIITVAPTARLTF